MGGCVEPVKEAEQLERTVESSAPKGLKNRSGEAPASPAKNADPLSTLLNAWLALRSVWFIALLSSMLNVFMMLEINLYLPYLYTRVTCCGEQHELDSRYDVTDPQEVARYLAEAAALGLEVRRDDQPAGSSPLRACELPAFPPGNIFWSLSPTCTNRAFVQDSAQSVMAYLKPLQKVFAILVLPVGGAISDSAGRRVVLLAYTVLIMIASGLSALDTQFHDAWGNAAVYTAGALLGLSFQPKDAILSSGVADVMGRDEETKSYALSGLVSLQTVGCLIVTALSYCWIRMHLGSYFVPWLCLVGLTVAMVLLLLGSPETLPAELRSAPTLAMFNPVSTQLRGVRLLLRDPVLVHLSISYFIFWAGFLGFITTKVSYLILVGFTIEDTVLPEIVANVFALFFAGVVLSLLSKVGVWWMCIVSHILWVVTYAFWGPFTVFFGHLGAYIANSLQVASFMMLLPAVQTIVSQRVESHNQGKCQSALSAIGTSGGIVGVPLWNHLLFSAKAQGLRRAWPALASMAMSLLCVVISLHTWNVARTTKSVTELEEVDNVELKALKDSVGA